MKKLNPLELKKHVDETNAQRAILKDIVFVENGVEVVGQIYVKKVSYKDLREIEKSFNWLPDEEDPGMLSCRILMNCVCVLPRSLPQSVLTKKAHRSLRILMKSCILT